MNQDARHVAVLDPIQETEDRNGALMHVRPHRVMSEDFRDGQEPIDEAGEVVGSHGMVGRGRPLVRPAPAQVIANHVTHIDPVDEVERPCEPGSDLEVERVREAKRKVPGDRMPSSQRSQGLVLESSGDRDVVFQDRYVSGPSQLVAGDGIPPGVTQQAWELLDIVGESAGDDDILSVVQEVGRSWPNEQVSQSTNAGEPALLLVLKNEMLVMDDDERLDVVIIQARGRPLYPQASCAH